MKRGQLFESIRCRGKWKAYIVTETGRGWYRMGKAFATQGAALAAVQRQWPEIEWLPASMSRA